jgi:hypothetical protein
MGKVAGQRVTFRASARIGAIAASLAAAAALLLPATAFAATSIGSPQGNQPCQQTADSVQASSTGPSYAVPADGTFITDWFFQATNGDTGSVNLLVWRPVDASTLTYTLIYISPTVTPSDPTSTFTLPAPISVLPGDLIGLRLTGDLTCVQGPVDPANVVGFLVNSTAAVGDTVSLFPAAGIQLNVGASVTVASNPVVTSTDQCKNGGWQTLTDSLRNPFKNQGDCVSFVATKGKNLAG